METKKTVGFASSLGFVLAAAGSAVGLGNIWAFPYKTSQNGGAAFVLLYVACVIFIGFVTMLSEIYLGRRAAANPITAYKKVSRNLGWCGLVAILIPTFITCYYAVLGGWTTKFAVNSFAGNAGILASFSVNTGEVILYTAIFVAIAAIIIACGVEEGIERMSKVLMPILFLIVVGVAIYSLTLGEGVSEGLAFYLKPDFSVITFKSVLAAMSQAFFSLSVAGSGSVIYGAYLGKNVKIRQSAVLCAVFDTSAALLAMLIIIPAMATVGADLGNGGPGLMFIYMLPVFNGLGAGISRVICIFFYLVVLFAGVSSIINLFETPVAFLQEKLRLKRLPATAIIHMLGVLVALMIQPWTSQWMDMVSIYLCPLGAFTAGIMFFWVMKKDTALAAAQLGDDKPLMKWFYPFGRYVFVPLCLLCFVLGIAMGGIG